jgi:hypothetical protein
LAGLRAAEPQEATDGQPNEEAPSDETRTSELRNGAVEASSENADEAIA